MEAFAGRHGLTTTVFLLMGLNESITTYYENKARYSVCASSMIINIYDHMIDGQMKNRDIHIGKRNNNNTRSSSQGVKRIP